MCLAPPIQNVAKGTAQIWPKYGVADADAKYNSYTNTTNVLPVLIVGTLYVCLCVLYKHSDYCVEILKKWIQFL